MDTTRDTVFAIIAKEAHVPLEKITMQAALKDLEIDSLDIVQIIFEVEDRFGIQLPEHDDKVDTDTVAGLIATVDRLVAEKAAAPPAAV